MCSPIALSVVENITSAANKGVELYQEAKNNEYRIQIAKNNAEIARQEALRYKQEGIQESRKQKILGIEQAKKELAKNSANGFDITSDTSMFNYQDVISKNYTEAKEIQKNYNLQSNKYFQQANNYATQAENYKDAYKNTLFKKGLIGLGNSFTVATEWFSENSENGGL